MRLRRTVAHARGQLGTARKTKGNPTKFHITSGEWRWRTVQTGDSRAEVEFHPTCSGLPKLHILRLWSAWAALCY